MYVVCAYMYISFIITNSVSCGSSSTFDSFQTGSGHTGSPQKCSDSP